MSKVYKINECEWYATDGTLGELIGWYDKNVDTIEDVEELQEIKECNIEKEGVWSEKNVTPEDIERLGDLDEYGSRPRQFGDLRRHEGEIVKYQSFKNILGDDEIKEPYQIASTEW